MKRADENADVKLVRLRIDSYEMAGVCVNHIVKEDLENIVSRIPYQDCEGKTFLITGASGFLAKYVVMTLMYLNANVLKEKCTVIALCRNEVKARSVFREYLEDANFILCIQSVEEPLPTYEKIDYILHAASSTITSTFEEHAAEILNANVAGTLNLLNLARLNKVKKFLFFSSGAVYGDIPKEILEIKEEDYFLLDFLNLNNCYAEGKRAGETLCRAYWMQFGVPTVSVRISHTYGPGIDIDDGHVFSDFIKSVLEHTNFVIKGDGKAVRPFCYVSDAVTAFFILLFRGKNGDAYNMANCEETYTIKELADKLASEVFAEKRLSVVGEHIYSGTVEKCRVNTAKLEELGWKALINVEDGFKRTVESFK